ncbi:putative polypeptide n-acetylgalactosaminyltransferase 12 [Besnoitia besnoiti]|uniref:Putative polypeptide n-acetylgalactosaminyltransferase 12 n=1 Tax=Besnoitia besnoiti TaxID=94643 RepID=A0A2A9MPU0_BESBE|nr:putative polypeptide n-acetylgalactosaminyltransferase 12 [Besnoitia besnoiti]PFH37900.1 putative polypeptide n-acetylgalactosaminyltransferase 12 [Besnoitia besnoiti]
MPGSIPFGGGTGEPVPAPWPSRVSVLNAEAAATGKDAKAPRSLNPKMIARLKRRCFLRLLFLALSGAIFWCLFVCGFLSYLFPAAFSRDPQAHLLDLNAPGVTAFHKLLKGLPLPRLHEKTTIDNSAVVVGVHGTVKAPYSRLVDHLLKLATLPILTGEPRYVTGDDLSVIIPVRNEEAYLPKTLKYLFETTPPERIHEVIIVDDNSDQPIQKLIEASLPEHMRKKMRFIRFDSYQGLIRGRIAGAAIATSENIFFLDGHCRPKPGWAEPLIAHLKINYRRIACPKIYDIYATTWEDVGTDGTKMMFEWTFEFGWFEDLEDEVPVLSGGILAMTKKWWLESGLYDDGMLEWGGENLEQSIRVWLCGGEIVAVQESKIGHIFSRPPKPNPGNRLVIQVQKNQKRAAKVWLDEYYNLFYKYHREVRTHQEGDTSARKRLRFEKLTCMPFQWFVEKFKTAFDRSSLLDHNFFHIQHAHTGMCLSSKKFPGFPDERLVLEPCEMKTRRQQWTVAGGGRLLANRDKKCVDAYGNQENLRAPILWKCDWNSVLQNKNANQFWQFDASFPGKLPASLNATGRIFSFQHPDATSLTGHDTLPVYRHLAVSHKARCLATEDEPEAAEKAEKAAGAGPRDVFVRWRSCDEPVVPSPPPSSPGAPPSSATAAEAGAKAPPALNAGDRMRFEPKWIYAPLSSRFGVRTLQDAERITDAAAQAYVDNPPQPVDAD